jgi:hypothetical protein
MAAMRAVHDAMPRGPLAMIDAVTTNAIAHGIHWANCPACGMSMDWIGRPGKPFVLKCTASGCGRFTATLRIGP